MCYRRPSRRALRRTKPYGYSRLFPFIANKKAWPHTPDVMCHDHWPMRHRSLLFAGVALDEPDLWRRCRRIQRSRK